MQLRLWWFVKARDERERKKVHNPERFNARAFFCYLSISFASASRTSSANDVSLTPPTTPGEAHRTHHGPKNDATKKRALSVVVVVVLFIFLVVASSSSFLCCFFVHRKCFVAKKMKRKMKRNEVSNVSNGFEMKRLSLFFYFLDFWIFSSSKILLLLLLLLQCNN